MEALFKNDQEIKEWVDLLIEKLLTVNLLSGNEADAEFYQGRQAVEKIAASFQEIFDLPKEVLVDGIRQLVEQRLPDHRVIDNFPDFYRLMNDMINAGLQNAGAIQDELLPQQIAGLKKLANNEGIISAPSSKVSLNGAGVLTKDLDSSFSLRQHLLKAMESGQASNCPMSIPKEAPNNIEVGIREDQIEELNNKTISTDIDIRDDINIIMDNMSEHICINDKTEEAHHLASPISKSLHELTDESMKQLLQESHHEIDQYSSAYAQTLPDHDSLIDSIADAANPVVESDDNLSQKQEESFLEKPLEQLEEAVPAVSLALVNNEPKKAIEKRNDYLAPRDPFRFNRKKRLDTKEPAEFSVQTPKSLAAPQQVPEDGKALAFILKQLYGESLIQWQIVLEGYTFFAKVDNLLVLVVPNDVNYSEQRYQEINTKMKEMGFKVFLCHQEDLGFPRRLERGIRRIGR